MSSVDGVLITQVKQAKAMLGLSSDRTTAHSSSLITGDRETWKVLRIPYGGTESPDIWGRLPDLLPED